MKNRVWSSCETVRPKDSRTVVVYRDDEYCANWPMTGGMWRFSDGEIIVGFTRLRVDYDKPGATSHLKLDTWGELCLVRSKDDGDTWDMDGVEVVVKKRETAISFFQEERPNENWNSVDFTSPDTILLNQYIGEHMWAATYGEVRFWSMILASPDRGRTWPLGPVVKKPKHLFSSWGLPSYVVRPNGSVLLFHDCIVKGNEKDHIMDTYVDILEEDGLRWNFHGVLPLERRDAHLVIHPAPLDLGNGAILLATRNQTRAGVVFVMLYRSDDWGRNWYTVGRVTDVGGTPHLLRLRDGRILLTCERRFPPLGIRARISDDEEGWRWGPEIILREDGGSGDLGYSRSVQRADGKVLTASYINLAGESAGVCGAVRHINGVVWDPDTLA